MGATQAMEFADMVEEGDVSLEQALAYHLQGNHFPPVSVDFIPACIAAIDAYNEEQYDRTIMLPNGKYLTAVAIIDGLHLQWFLPADDVEY